MAVHRRDRSFSKIIDEVDMEAIPVHYIKTIIINFEDGSLMELNKQDLKKIDTIEELLISKFNEENNIVDMSIELDFDLIEENVTDKVNRLLSKDQEKNDSSDSSM